MPPSVVFCVLMPTPLSPNAYTLPVAPGSTETAGPLLRLAESFRHRRPGDSLVRALQHHAADSGLHPTGVDVAVGSVKVDGPGNSGHRNVLPGQTAVNAPEGSAVSRHVVRGETSLAKLARHVEVLAVPRIDE